MGINMTASLLRRIGTIERTLAADRGVASVCVRTPDEAARAAETIADLHAAGFRWVYVANIAGRGTFMAHDCRDVPHELDEGTT